MDERVQVKVERQDRNDSSLWYDDQPVKVTFNTATGPVEAWIDHAGDLVLRSNVSLLMIADGQSQVRVRA